MLECENLKYPIRILCVFSLLDRGGAESMCMNLYRNIDKNLVQFDFVKHTDKVGEFEKEILSLGGRIFTAPKYTAINHISYCKWWKNFLTEHPEHQIVHGHYFTISAVYLSVTKRMGRITIGHIHGMSFVGNVNNLVGNAFIRMIARSTVYRFACSKAAGKWAYRKAEFTVLNNAVDSARFAFDPARRAAMREQLHIGEDEKVIFVVANLSEVKNPLGALDIYSAIRRRNPNVRLFWAGEGGMRGPMEQKIATEQIPGVTLLGTRSDVPDLLQAADAFMLCSFCEGLGMVAIEAQAAGLPCLLSEGIPCEASVTDLCTLLPLGNPEAWADAYETIKDTPRRNTHAEICTAGYDVKETAEWLTNFYLNCKG